MRATERDLTCGVIIILYNQNYLLVDDNDQEKKGKKDIS